MNQILNTKHLKKFKIQFFISLILLVFFTIYWIYFHNTKSKKNFSDTLLNNFNIERIYSNTQNYNVLKLNDGTSYFVIGIIEIPKIYIKYPILSNTSDELLKISACRFYGPYPNKIGNLCIAAHNYDNNSFFSNLYKLNYGDIINIYDINNSIVSYYVYNKFETHKNNTSYISQNTNGNKEITLVTCNNITKNRLIIKAKAK